MGIVLAPGIWFMRNLLSDPTMLAFAHQAEDADGYRAYLARGGRRPRWSTCCSRAPSCRCGQGGQRRSGREIYRCASQFASIQNEVSSALRQAMLRRARHLKKAPARCRCSPTSPSVIRTTSSTPSSSKRSTPSTKAALATLQKGIGGEDGASSRSSSAARVPREEGPKAEIRFRRKKARNPGEIADTRSKRAHFSWGRRRCPRNTSTTLIHVRARHRQQSGHGPFRRRLRPRFLSVDLGAPITDPDAPLPASNVPTLFIEHTAELSGASYLNANPRGVFVGLGMVFDVTFKIPDDAKPHKYKQTAWRPPDVTLSKGDAETWETAVYDAMAVEGFSQFTAKYLATFFGKPDTKAASDSRHRSSMDDLEVAPCLGARTNPPRPPRAPRPRQGIFCSEPLCSGKRRCKPSRLHGA